MPSKRDTFDLDGNSSSENISATASVIPEAPAKRITLPLTPDGKIDYASMRGLQKEKLNVILTQQFADWQASLPKQESVVFNRDFVPTLYDSFAAFLQLVSKYAMKWPDDLRKHLKYSKDQKEALKEPTAKLIEYYSPTWLMNNQVLANFCMAFSVQTKAMFEGAVMAYALEIRLRQDAEPVKPNGHNVNIPDNADIITEER